MQVIIIFCVYDIVMGDNNALFLIYAVSMFRELMLSLQQLHNKLCN